MNSFYETKRAVGKFLKVAAILGLLVFHIIHPHLIYPFVKMVVIAGGFIWLLRGYNPDEEPEVIEPTKKKEESVAEYLWRTEPIAPPQIFDQNGHLR